MNKVLFAVKVLELHCKWRLYFSLGNRHNTWGKSSKNQKRKIPTEVGI